MLVWSATVTLILTRSQLLLRWPHSVAQFEFPLSIALFHSYLWECHRTSVPSDLRQVRPRMRAFSYMWSLLVMWRRWQSHHSICHSQKLHTTHKRDGCLYRTGVMGDWSLHCGNRDFGYLVPVTLTLTRWPSYTNLTLIGWSYSGCANKALRN